jgi:SAM-dependent methyltransferase
MKGYWDSRFESEEKIWGERPSRTAEYALELFEGKNISRILVPGAGYGRNTKLFSSKGYSVTGVEISEEAYKIALAYDKATEFHNSSILDVKLPKESYDAIYCFNVLHLFREGERALFLEMCFNWLKPGGVAFFTVFSTEEKSYGKGNEVEKNTFESKQGRPVHYFSDQDIKSHFLKFDILETGLMEDTENHGDEGEHVHTLRYIFAQKTSSGIGVCKTL